MDVVALGELLIDFTCVGTDADGYPTMAAHPGGAPANFLAALTKFGAKTALLGQIPLGALGQPEDIGSAVAFLASEQAGYITGQVLGVDGGMGM